MIEKHLLFLNIALLFIIYYGFSNEKVTSIEAHKSVIKVVQFSNDGKFLATAAEDKTLKIWKINKTEGKVELQLLGELYKYFSSLSLLLSFFLFIVFLFTIVFFSN